jgi:hypothetical protein
MPRFARSLIGALMKVGQLTFMADNLTCTRCSCTCTVPFLNRKVFVRESCPISVLTKLLFHSRQIYAENDLKKFIRTQLNLVYEKMQSGIPKFTNTFFRIDYDHGLNSCRCLNPESPPLPDLGSLYFLIRHTFVVAIFFRVLNFN